MKEERSERKIPTATFGEVRSDRNIEKEDSERNLPKGRSNWKIRKGAFRDKYSKCRATIGEEHSNGNTTPELLLQHYSTRPVLTSMLQGLLYLA